MTGRPHRIRQLRGTRSPPQPCTPGAQCGCDTGADRSDCLTRILHLSLTRSSCTARHGVSSPCCMRNCGSCRTGCSTSPHGCAANTQWWTASARSVLLLKAGSTSSLQFANTSLHKSNLATEQQSSCNATVATLGNCPTVGVHTQSLLFCTAS